MKGDSSPVGQYFNAMFEAFDGLDIYLREDESPLYRHHLIGGIVVDYLERYPDVGVSALFLDRNVNLLEEGVDVGIRIGNLPDSTLNARKVGEVRLLTCASPGYLGKHPAPKHPGELTNHTLIVSSAGNNALDWHFDSQDKNHSIRVRPRLTVSTNDAALEATTKGFGITRILSYQVAPLLESGVLEIVLEDYASLPRPVNIIHREGRYVSAKVRTFVDLMVERLRADSALQGRIAI